MNSWAFVLDLDDTLVLTSTLLQLRKQRKWQEVYEAFGTTTLPLGTRDFLDSIRCIGKFGVVTSAPRPYAERLVAYHKLEIPVLVAYHDVTQVKPAPEALVKAAAMLGVSLAHCVHIGDANGDETSSQLAGCPFIRVSWDNQKEGTCGSWNCVLDKVKGIVSPMSKN